MSLSKELIQKVFSIIYLFTLLFLFFNHVPTASKGLAKRPVQVLIAQEARSAELYASVSQRLLFKFGAKKTKSQTSSRSLVYQQTIQQKQYGYQQTTKSLRLIEPANAVRMKADLPVDPTKELTDEQKAIKAKVVNNYNFKDLSKEYAENFSYFKAELIKMGETDLANRAEQILIQHREFTGRFKGETNPSEHCQYVGNNPKFKAYRDEVNRLSNTKPDGKRSAALRALNKKYAGEFIHLQQGAIGLDDNGELIMTQTQKKKYNNLVRQIAQWSHRPDPEILEHQVQPRWTSATDKHGPRELNLGFAREMISGRGNVTLQHAFLNHVDESYLKFCFDKTLNKKTSELYSLGAEVCRLASTSKFAYRHQLSRAVFPMQEGVIYLATKSKRIVQYYNQLSNINQTLESCNQYIAV